MHNNSKQKQQRNTAKSKQGVNEAWRVPTRVGLRAAAPIIMQRRLSHQSPRQSQLCLFLCEQGPPAAGGPKWTRGGQEKRAPTIILSSNLHHPWPRGAGAGPLRGPPPRSRRGDLSAAKARVMAERGRWSIEALFPQESVGAVSGHSVQLCSPLQ